MIISITVRRTVDWNDAILFNIFFSFCTLEDNSQKGLIGDPARDRAVSTGGGGQDCFPGKLI
jgi:hypothetical protein